MSQNKKLKIILFQPHLRKPILNFGRYLKNFKYYKITFQKNDQSFYSSIPRYEQEITRTKTNIYNKIRRILGIINLRIKLFRNGDLIFTYGCMLITNKPYCIYIENGLTIYNYDLRIAKNPIARILFYFLIRSQRLKKLIFMSEASQKSFLSSLNYGENTKAIIKQKSIVCYPAVKYSGRTEIRHYKKPINILFSGMFYMKGGAEIIKAFKRLQEKYADSLTLTIVTPLQAVKKEDVSLILSYKNIKLLDAKQNEQEMNNLYANNDIFLLPTYRDSFGLVVLEALSHGMPIICTNQYALTEMVIDDFNGFVAHDHPLKNYDCHTYQLSGKYYNPRDFYHDLFKYQELGRMKVIEDFIYDSIEKFILNPDLMEKFSKNSLELYNKKFHYQLLSNKIEEVFLEAIKK